MKITIDTTEKELSPLKTLVDAFSAALQNEQGTSSPKLDDFDTAVNETEKLMEKAKIKIGDLDVFFNAVKVDLFAATPVISDETDRKEESKN
jgi:hypothetical protein